MYEITKNKFSKIITPVYQLLPKYIRFRQNYKQLKTAKSQ